MLRALASGVSGLKGQEARLDVIGNNIANANTTGFRAGRLNFADLFSQSLSSGAAGTATLGSQNPAQIGLGVQVAGVDVVTTAGSLERTGQDTDLAVQGNGFFILKDASGAPLYTRAGHFGWDAQGYLVNPGTGQRVQGWMALPNGTIASRTAGSLADVRIAMGQNSAQATSQFTLTGVLDAGAPVGTNYTTPATAFDSSGRAWNLQISFRKVATNTWDWAVTDPNTNAFGGSGPSNGGSSFSPATGQLIFGTNGVPSTPSTDGAFNFLPPGSAPVNLTLHFGSLTQLSGSSGSSAAVTSQDGMAAGAAASVTVDNTGTVYQLFSNGSKQAVAQIALASVPNPAGLLRAGSSNFSTSSASGLVQVGAPGTGLQGTVSTGVLEQSNVDLSQEFTDLIVTQRAFQANTRVITASDEVLQDLVNLRH